MEEVQLCTNCGHPMRIFNKDATYDIYGCPRGCSCNRSIDRRLNKVIDPPRKTLIEYRKGPNVADPITPEHFGPQSITQMGL